MNDTQASKVIVVEEPPRMRGIPSAATSVVGAVGLTERGPIGQATLVNSFESFQALFGGFTRHADLPLAAMGFFENGGRQLWVVRTAHYTDISDPNSTTARRAYGDIGNVVEDAVVGLIRIEAKDPGIYGNRFSVEVRTAASGDTRQFDLLVYEEGVFREWLSNLSMSRDDPRYFPNLIHHPQLGSSYIRATDIQSGELAVPTGQTITLSGGHDGLQGLTDADYIGHTASKTGLHALDTVQDLSLLITPGRATPAVHQAMLNYGELARQGTVFSILDPPVLQKANDIVDYVTSAKLLNASEYGAIYWPRVHILNPNQAVFGLDPHITAPPSGIIAGVYARTDGATAGGIYTPPAGIEKGRMVGVLGFEMPDVLEEAQRDIVYPKRINPLTTGPGLPRFIDGARTLKGNGLFPYIAERRGVMFIARSLKEGLQFARHQNNTESLRAQVRRTLTAFLMTQMNNGAFRSQNPDSAFFVDVSDELNTPAVIFSGQLIARIGVATNKPAEFIILRISQDTRRLEAELSGGG